MLNTRIVALSVPLVLVLALLAGPALAAPAGPSHNTAACSGSLAPHALGVDGGLSALRTEELTVASAAAPQPPGVDGGLLSLLFARSDQARSFAQVGNGCAAAAIVPGASE